MNHIGYGSYFCHNCKEQTLHRILEMKGENGNFTVKLCNHCKPVPLPKLSSEKPERQHG